MALGFNRNLAGKQMGMRTLALVSLGAAAIAVSAITFSDLAQFPDTLGRVVQGIVQGVLIGIGFIGAGTILRDREQHTVHGLTTAATVWVTAALGVTCGFGAWPVVLIGVILTLAILFVFHWIEERWHMID